MQLLQGQVLEQRARLAICAGLSCQLLYTLGQGWALVGLGCLKHLLQQPHPLGPVGMLQRHGFSQSLHSYSAVFRAPPAVCMSTASHASVLVSDGNDVHGVQHVASMPYHPEGQMLLLSVQQRHSHGAK